MFQDNDKIINIINIYSNFLTKSDFFLNCLRMVGWYIIKGLAFLVGNLEKAINSVTSVTDFFDSSSVNGLIDKFKPILGVLLVFSIIFIGYQLMLNKKYDRSRIPMNVILALCVIVVLPIAMNKLNKITNLGMNEVRGSMNISKQIVSNNVTDLYLIDEANFPTKDGKVEDLKIKNNFGNNILNINPNEEIDRSKTSNSKIFENEVIRDKNGKAELNEINGLFKWDDEYYRFHINFLTIICTLIISAFVLIFTGVKMAKLSMELAFSKIMTTFVAVGDLSGGQKLRQSINGIISIFVAMISTMLMLKLYILGTAYLSDKIGGIGTIVAMLGTAIFVIDGPNYIEKLFGIDAGLSSAWRATTGINSALDIANKIGKATGNTLDRAKGLGEGILGGLAFAKGMADEGMSNLEDEMDNEKTDNNNNNNETLDNQMGKEENKDNINGDNIDDNNIENPNLDENEDNNINSLDDDIDNESSEYDNKNLGNEENEENENNPSSLEEDINDESNPSSLEEDINNGNINSDNINSDITGDNQSTLDSDIEANNSSIDSVENNSDKIIDDNENSDIKDGLNENRINEGSINENIDNNYDSNIDNEPTDNIDNKNNDIGYENPIEDRNIYGVIRDNLKSKGLDKANDLTVRLDRSYQIGRNTSRDIKNFINKDKRGVD